MRRVGTRTPKARWKWVFVHVHRQQNRLGGRAEGFERRRTELREQGLLPTRQPTFQVDRSTELSACLQYQKTLIETSAKANTNVEQAFETLAEQVLCKRKAELERSAAAQADADAEKRKQNAGPAKKENEEGCCTLL